MRKRLLRALKRAVPVLCVIGSLACLPAAALQWAGARGADEGPLHLSTARRCAAGAPLGRRGNDLREMFRTAERSCTSFRALATRLAGVDSALRGRAGSGAAENHQRVASRRSLLRYASGRAADDPPA